LTFIVVASGQRSTLIAVLSAKSVALSTRNLRMIAKKRGSGRTLSLGRNCLRVAALRARQRDTAPAVDGTPFELIGKLARR
jgi:hypothetical protein